MVGDSKEAAFGHGEADSNNRRKMKSPLFLKAISRGER
jgi:hypothetical protein